MKKEIKQYLGRDEALIEAVYDASILAHKVEHTESLRVLIDMIVAVARRNKEWPKTEPEIEEYSVPGVELQRETS